MSWIERIKKDIIIRTGDGKTFSPLYVLGSRDIDYNVAEFNFINVGGTLVKRNEYKGTRYSLDVIFQGENNIEDAREFELSARDPRPWTISHPLYDNILVQPTKMKIDSSKLNLSTVNISLVETISEENPKSTQDAEGKVKQDVLNQAETAGESFSNQVTPTTEDLNLISENTELAYKKGIDFVFDDHEANNYFNLFNKANAAIIDGTQEPFLMISAVQDVLIYPSLFSTTVKDRFTLLKSQLDGLKSKIETLTTKNSKTIFENNSAAIITAMVNTSVSPLNENDYQNKKDVLKVVDDLLFYYNGFISDIDYLQSPNGYNVGAYIPDFDSMSSLKMLVNFTIDQLFNIALNARQEREIQLEDDSNIYVLTHRFYGLDVNDSSIDEFIRNNSIGMSELLGLKKGRFIKYYV